MTFERASAWPKETPAWTHCAAIAVVCGCGFFLFGDSLPLLTRVAIMAILVLSLDLVVGFAGLATLGHVAYFGVGAYVAGNVALRMTGDPLVGASIAAGAGAAAAAVTGLMLLRYQGFTFLMLTVAVAQIVQSAARKLSSWTGSDDGLSGFSVSPLFGARFDMMGQTAYVYAAFALVACYGLTKRIVGSPFGLSIQGIHQSRKRMAALGTPVFRQLWLMYVIAGGMAGLAGALSAQTNGIVGLDSLSFELSAEIIVMLALGGAGKLYGALAGTAIFVLLHHTASSINPYHWLFVVGGLLMLVVMLPRNIGWIRLPSRRQSVPSQEFSR